MAQQRERALTQAYIFQRCQGKRVILGCPLGPVPEVLVATWGRAAALRVGRGLRPEVDALIFEEDHLVLVETKIIRWMDGVAKLPVYKGLLPTTPELEPYWRWPVEMRLVTPWTMETIEAAARAQGVIVEEFTTPDVDAYVKESHKYWTPAWRNAQADKRRARELLGLD